MTFLTAVVEKFNRTAPVIATSTGERLQRIAAQWTPAPAAVLLDAVPQFIATETVIEDPPPPNKRALRVPSLDGRSWRGLLFIVLGSAVFVGWMWFQGRPRDIAVAPEVVAGQVATGGVDAPAGPVSSSAGMVVVHVVGAVVHPGLVQLPAGSRVDDAIIAVGGAKGEKALASVNLARMLVDGEQIVVGAAPGVVPGSSIDAAGLLSLNSASESELEALPGIGPVLASRIIDWRTTNGPFRNIDELGEVSGVGASVLEQLRSLVRL